MPPEQDPADSDPVRISPCGGKLGRRVRSPVLAAYEVRRRTGGSGWPGPPARARRPRRPPRAGGRPGSPAPAPAAPATIRTARSRPTARTGRRPRSTLSGRPRSGGRARAARQPPGEMRCPGGVTGRFPGHPASSTPSTSTPTATSLACRHSQVTALAASRAAGTMPSSVNRSASRRSPSTGRSGQPRVGHDRRQPCPMPRQGERHVLGLADPQHGPEREGGTTDPAKREEPGAAPPPRRHDAGYGQQRSAPRRRSASPRPCDRDSRPLPGSSARRRRPGARARATAAGRPRSSAARRLTRHPGPHPPSTAPPWRQAGARPRPGRPAPPRRRRQPARRWAACQPGQQDDAGHDRGQHRHLLVDQRRSAQDQPEHHRLAPARGRGAAAPPPPASAAGTTPLARGSGGTRPATSRCSTGRRMHRLRPRPAATAPTAGRPGTSCSTPNPEPWHRAG